MKKFNILILILLLFSCEQPAMEYLQVTPPKDTSLTHEGGAVTATATASEQPKASSDKTWARTAVTADGDDSYTVTVTARQNIWENERCAVITVTAGTLSESFTVTQAGEPADKDEPQDGDNENQDNGSKDDEDTAPAAPARVLRIRGERNVNVAEGEREAVLEFETDIPLDSLKASADAEWITATLSEGRICLSIEANDLLEDRTSSVTLEALVDGVKALEWQVVQDPEIVTPEGMVEFEDLAFKKAVVKDHDADGDRQISVEEAEAIRRLDVSGLGIRSLKGVGPMRSLEYLDIRNNLMADRDTSKVTVVDLSDPHPFLIDVLCDDYSAIDFTGCPIMVWTGGANIIPLKSTIYNLQYIEKKHPHKYDVNNGELLNCYTDCHYKIISKPTRGEDISREGERIYLKRHTKGPGIEISFTIYDLIDIDVESGLDERIGQIILDNLFVEEPIKTFEEYYDLVYIITEDRYRDKNDYPDKGSYDLDSEWYQDIAMFAGKRRSTMMPNGIDFHIDRSNSYRIDINHLINDSDILDHETVGHNIGRLNDEYTEKGGTPPEGKKTRYFSNTLYTPNPDKDIPWYWKSLMENPDYENLVGLYEGAWYVEDAWRSIYQRCEMNASHNFCALCRFVWIAHFLYDSELYLEVLPDVSTTVKNLSGYEALFDSEANRQALMDFFLEYDKKNL